MGLDAARMRQAGVTCAMEPARGEPASAAATKRPHLQQLLYPEDLEQLAGLRAAAQAQEASTWPATHPAQRGREAALPLDTPYFQHGNTASP